MPKKFREEDMKICEECKTVFLQANCPCCSGAEWRYASRMRGLNEQWRQETYQILMASSKGYINEIRM